GLIDAAVVGVLAEARVAAPLANCCDRCREPAAAPCCEAGPGETGLQLSEHPLTAGLWSVVGGVVQAAVRQRQFGNGAPRLAVLHRERTGGVREVVLAADLPDPHRDLVQPVAGQ